MSTQTEKRLKAFDLLMPVGSVFASEILPPQDELDAMRSAIETGDTDDPDLNDELPSRLGELDEIIAMAEERKNGLHQFVIKLRESDKLPSDVTEEMVMKFIEEESVKSEGLVQMTGTECAAEVALATAKAIRAMEPIVADKIITSLEELVETLNSPGDGSRQVQTSLDFPVADLEISVRSRSALIETGIKTLGELTQTTEQELLDSKNFGGQMLTEIKELLAFNGLQLKPSTDEEWEEINRNALTGEQLARTASHLKKTGQASA